VATGVETTGEQVLECLLDRSGLRGQVEVVRRPGRPSDMERHFADVSRLSDLGWTPAWRLDESLEEVVGYYLRTVQRASDPASGGSAGARPAPAPVVLRTSSSHRCTVQLRAGLLDDLPDALTRRFPGARLVVLTDSVVQDLYGRALVDGLDAAGADVGLVTVPSGEASKSATSLLEVIAQLHELRTDRRSVLVCVGGGMVTDLGGFAAATYLRGIAYVNVPTTLLAQHDSAIGGKVGVNMPWAKNFVGAFHHPIEVHADPRVLRTLDDRNLRCGIAESVKVALCGAPGLFEMIEDSRAALMAREPEVLEDLVRRSAEHKVALLSPDPYEVDLACAHLGHTFGHAVETEYGYERAPRQAVAPAGGRCGRRCAPGRVRAQGCRTHPRRGALLRDGAGAGPRPAARRRVEAGRGPAGARRTSQLRGADQHRRGAGARGAAARRRGRCVGRARGPPTLRSGRAVVTVPAAVGVDLGGTKLLAVVMVGDEVAASVSRPTGRTIGVEGVARLLDEVLDALAASSGLSMDGCQLAVGFPGLVDGASARVRRSVILDGWDGVDVADALSDDTRRVVGVANDVHRAAAGEVWFRRRRGETVGDLMCITVGTGIGGAIVIDGQVWPGVGRGRRDRSRARRR
jgi:3-dehydroquinate synthetase